MPSINIINASPLCSPMRHIDITVPSNGSIVYTASPFPVSHYGCCYKRGIARDTFQVKEGGHYKYKRWLELWR